MQHHLYSLLLTNNKCLALHDVEAKWIRRNGIYSPKCVRINFSFKNITVLGFPQVFDKRILLKYFLHDIFHFCASQRSQKLILHEKLDAYPHISFITKGLSIVQKLRAWCESLKVIFLGILTRGNEANPD